MINNPKDISKSEETENGLICLRHDFIITFEPRIGLRSANIEQMKKDLIVFHKFTDGKPLPLLSDNRRLNEFGSEERIFMQEKLPEFCSKMGVLVNNGMSLYFFNIIQYLNKPSIPLKAFKNTDNALKWLKE